MKIGVVSHKDFDDNWLPDCYRVVKVGDACPSQDASARGWELDDDLVPNIHHENPWYCELTAHYYIWKKWVPVHDVVGLVHYRRLFVDYRRSSKSFSEDVLASERIDEILNKHKIILPFQSFKRRGQNAMKGVDCWSDVFNVIERLYPSYLDSYSKAAESRITTFGNRLIAGSELFDEYSEWLFAILDSYDRMKKERHEEKDPRVDGYISELLLNAWTEKTCRAERYTDALRSIQRMLHRLAHMGMAFLGRSRGFRIQGRRYWASYSCWQPCQDVLSLNFRYLRSPLFPA